jgi:hypothetical protein
MELSAFIKCGDESALANDDAVIQRGERGIVTNTPIVARQPWSNFNDFAVAAEK